MAGTLTSEVCSINFITNEHPELNDGVHLGLYQELVVTVQHAGLTEHRPEWLAEQRHGLRSGHLHEGDAVQVGEDGDNLPAVSRLDRR